MCSQSTAQTEIDQKALVVPQPLMKDHIPPQKRLQKRITAFLSSSTKPEHKFRILSLDGGGMRGIFVSVVLDRLVQRFPTLLQEVELVAGTSTGAILTALIAAGYPPRSCTAVYRRHLAEVFKSNTTRRLRFVVRCG